MECFKYDKMCNIELYVHNFVLQMQILCGLACSHFSVFVKWRRLQHLS